MIYDLQHATLYHYAAPCDHSFTEVRLRPRSLPGQQCEAFDLEVHPRPSQIIHRTDFFGNDTIYFAIHHPHERLKIISRSRVMTRADVPADTPSADITVEAVATMTRDPSSSTYQEALPFALQSQSIPFLEPLQEYAAESLAPDRRLTEAVAELNQRLFEDFDFDPSATEVATPVLEAFENRNGVCQDFAQIALGCLRSNGLPARYVSGYLETLPPPGQERLVGADASHAWFSIFAPGRGWVDFDPTNNLMPGERHITVAWGRDYKDVPPVKGVASGSGGHTMEYAVDMRPAEDCETMT